MGEVDTASARPEPNLRRRTNSPLLRSLALPEVQVGLALALLNILVFAPVTACDFINFDDPVYVSGNFNISDGLSREGIVWSFTTLHAGYWQPLTWLSFELDVELFQVTPAAFHRTNLILHVLNVLLLYSLLVRMTGSWPASAVVAALFSVHPLRVETVAWITERKGLLSTFFGLLAVAAYLRYLRRPAVTRYTLLLLAYAASLACKPTLITLPGVLLLLDWWPLRRLEWGQLAAGAAPQLSIPPASLRRVIAEKLSLVAMALVTCAVGSYAQARVGALKTLEHFPLSLRFGNALDSTVMYLKQTLWPTDLAVYYPYPRSGVPSLRLVGGGLLLLAITAGVLRWARTRPYLVVGWLWYLGTLVPVLGLVQLGQQARADRFTYVPQIGLWLAVVWGLKEALPARRQMPGLGLVALLVLLPCILLTRLQIGHWKNSLTLWEHTLERTGDNPLARTLYAYALRDAQREEEAKRHLEEAIQIDPRMDVALDLLGSIHEQQGRREQALVCFRAALAARPDRVYYQARVTKLEQDLVDRPAPR